MGKEVLISCEDAGLGYDNKAIIAHFDFQVEEGDYICVVGENGSGKSTLIKTLLGLIRPVSGTIRRSASLEQGAIGYLPQQTQIQRHFPVSVMEVALSGFLNEMRFRPFYMGSQRKEAAQNLKKLGIWDLHRSCYGELSGGQQQRVLLARALCAADRILVLDEPMTGLDPVASQSLYDSLRTLNQEGMAVVMVTHDIQKALEQSQKILHMSDGGYFFGATEEYLRSEYAGYLSNGADRSTRQEDYL